MKTCEVCELCDSKYRCPSCRVLYCSVGCFKSHKGRCEEFQLPQQKEIPNTYVKNKKDESKDDPESGELTDSDSENEDKVGEEQLSLLEDSKSINDMLENKNLREIIKNIDENIDPGNELESAMRLPIFAEFANKCLNIFVKRKPGGDVA